MISYIPDFITSVKWLSLFLLLVYGKRIVRAIGGKDGLDKKEVCAMGLFILGSYMVYTEGKRADLAHQLYSDVLYLVIFGSSILGFGIKDILKVIEFVATRGNARQEQPKDQSTSGDGPV